MKSSEIAPRAAFMTTKQKEQMEGVKHRLHHICKAKTGVARPGKTARDRALRGH